MIIRKLDIQDLEVRVEWMNHPKVYSSMHYEIPVTLENTKKWFEKNMSNKNRVDFSFEVDGVLVAMGGLTGIDFNLNKAELYIFVNPNEQKTGLGTQAVRLLCQYGFEQLNLNKIFLLTNEDNYAARKVYEKCGFKLEGILRQEYKTSDNFFGDRYYFGLLKSDCDE